MANENEYFDEQIEASGQEADRESADDAREPLEVEVAVDRPGPGVGEYQPIEDVWTLLNGG